MATKYEKFGVQLSIIIKELNIRLKNTQILLIYLNIDALIELSIILSKLIKRYK